MFAEQVVATGFFLTSDTEYAVKLPHKTLSGDTEEWTAQQAIQDWCDRNFLEEKLLEISIEMKAFGNSFWNITSEGFTKIPVEAMWHAVRIAPEIPLQNKYHLQLVPIYGGQIVEWGQFVHFRIGVTGYHAPFGQGVLYALLMKPIDSSGTIAPSIYDIRLSMRNSLDMGFRKFSFGNELWCFPEMSNEDFENNDMAGKISKMSPTGNRIATNVDGKIHLAVPERTQSYDKFIEMMRDEFFMALADPSLKLGLEKGFTRATSVTASEVYRYKIATMRRSIKHHFELLWVQILNKLGYDGDKAKVQINFGPEETAVYNIADIFAAVNGDIITRNEARELLSAYHKWDIDGEIKQGDLLTSERGMQQIGGASKPRPIGTGTGDKAMPEAPSRMQPAQTQSQILQQQSMGAGIEALTPMIVVTPLADAVARYNKDLSIVYIDPTIPQAFHKVLVAREIFEYQLEFGIGMPYEEAEQLANRYEKSVCVNLGINYIDYDVAFKASMKEVNERQPKPLNPSDVIIHG